MSRSLWIDATIPAFVSKTDWFRGYPEIAIASPSRTRRTDSFAIFGLGNSSPMRFNVNPEGILS